MRRCASTSRGDDGFTLVEIIIAMFVLAIVMLAIIFVQARALTTNADSQSRQEATALANEAMEQMRSMPWNYLKKGLYSGFAGVVPGGDPFVTGTSLTVDGRTYQLRIANALSDQDLSDPWLPLFDSTGSNAQVFASGSGNGTTVTIRAYTTDDQAGSTDAIGLVVVATWGKRIDGTTQHTVVTSSAYAPESGCGDLNNAPFLASCQAVFEGNASTARVVIGATASTADGATSVPLLPSISQYQLQASTASAAARVTSQQFSTAESYAVFGGVVWDDNDPATQPKTSGWVKGFDSYTVRASDDTTVGAPPKNPTDVSGTGTSSATSFSSGSFAISGRGDEPRGAVADASTTAACSTGLASGIPGGSPCAHGSVSANSSGTGYVTLTVGGNSLHVSRVLSTSGSSTDHAWGGRFANANGNLYVGCSAVSGSGCTSAGAQQTFGDIVIGDVQQTGQWDGDAGSGLVVIDNYSDSVRTERGSNQTATAASVGRSATIDYWNGTGYTTVNVGPGTSLSPVSIGTATWTVSGTATIEASGTVAVASSFGSSGGAAPCKDDDACTVSAGNGTIVVAISYLVTPDDASIDPWVITVVTTVNGSQASASFKESPNA